MCNATLLGMEPVQQFKPNSLMFFIVICVKSHNIHDFVYFHKPLQHTTILAAINKCDILQVINEYLADLTSVVSEPETY